MTTKTVRLYVAKESATSVMKDGTPFVVKPGDEPIAEDDPRYTSNPSLFREWQPVEQMTAAPGERRNR